MINQVISSLEPRKKAIQNAQNILLKRPVYLDTETTGIDKVSEIVEIAIIDSEKNIVFQSFVKPSRAIPANVTKIHGITNQMVAQYPSFPILWQQIRSIIGNNLIAAYNAEFDIRMIKQSYTQYRLPWKDNLQNFCIMKLYAQFRGEWDSIHQSYRYFSLEKAGKDSNISLINSHRAADDALLALALLHFIANET